MQLFVVCTAYVIDTEPEPEKGRIVLLQLASGNDGAKEIKFLGETMVRGAAYQARPLPNAPGKIAVTMNARVIIFSVNASISPGGGPWRAFEMECKKSLHTVSLFLAVHGDTLVVGDMMQSVSVLKYIPERSHLELVAAEYDCAPSSCPGVCAHVT